ncbi:hypothetical protein P43SY_008046 [Pythium insidiosum]|uniref:Telomerase Cajal body protein 1 n=1 Tax=Pythium insidiosum TaxID=114742 RepID=A0AAD5Q9G4_PYTIN|nr:hypothetical protein P43SY_008046 [Pythium insidiosum]
MESCPTEGVADPPLAVDADDGASASAADATQQPTAAPLSFFHLRVGGAIRSVFTATAEFAEPTAAVPNNFTRGVKVAPDGLCVLTSSEDQVLRLFDVPTDDASAPAAGELRSSLQAKEGGAIYDFCWYPFMRSSDPTSCIFVSTSRDHPIHMWDAYSGALRATYRAFDHLDEITAAFSVAFNATGDKIFAGYDRTIRVFDITRPSRDFETRALCKTRRSREGQRGIISTLHFNPALAHVYAAGSYNGTTYVYSEDTGEEILCLRDHDGRGITQVQFSPCGNYLYTAARRDATINCWDVRHSLQVVQSFSRLADTNQRIEFDVHCTGRYLIAGSRDGRALLYDVPTGERVDERLTMPDAVNGVSFFPDPTRARVALTTGQRHFEIPGVDDSDDDEATHEPSGPRNALHVVEFEGE